MSNIASFTTLTLIAAALWARPCAAADAVTPDVVNAPIARGDWELRLGLGVQHEAGDVDFNAAGALNYAITDRWTWALPLPAFSYRWGETGSAELIARGGLTGLGYSSIDGLIGFVDAGVTGQAWLLPELSLVANATAQWDFQTVRRTGAPSRSDSITVRAVLGASFRPAPWLTVSAGAGWARDVSVHDADVADALRHELLFGSVLSLGYRPLPLVQFHLSPRFSLDAYAAWAPSLRDGVGSRATYLAGFTWGF